MVYPCGGVPCGLCSWGTCGDPWPGAVHPPEEPGSSGAPGVVPESSRRSSSWVIWPCPPWGFGCIARVRLYSSHADRCRRKPIYRPVPQSLRSVEHVERERRTSFLLYAFCCQRAESPGFSCEARPGTVPADNRYRSMRHRTLLTTLPAVAGGGKLRKRERFPASGSKGTDRPPPLEVFQREE